jgi:hypothetical protein
MDERTAAASASPRPVAAAPTDSLARADEPGPDLRDPRAVSILTAEHQSLLSARSLVYNEAYTRSGMFLTFLSATLVALGFVSQGGGFGQPEFLLVAVALLGFDLLIGLATLGRVVSASAEELRALQAMNRLRSAYLDIVPSVGRYISASQYDDVAGVLSVYGAPERTLSPVASLAHGLTTTPGMIAMIDAIVGGAFGAALALLLGARTTIALVVGVAAFVALFGLFVALGARTFSQATRDFEVRFPSPPAQADRRPD